MINEWTQLTTTVSHIVMAAFDTVNHSILLRDIQNSTLPNDLKHGTSNYLGGRQAFVDFREQKSSHRKIKMGVPQGGVLSPIFFNIYLTSLPDSPLKVSMVSYADDSTVFASGVNVMTFVLE